MNKKLEGIVEVIYDGDCPVCAAFVSRATSVSSEPGQPKYCLIDARRSRSTVDRLRREGFDIDNGMIVTIAGRCYYGDEAIVALSSLNIGEGSYHSVSRLIATHPRVAKFLYPGLVVLRKSFLKLTGRGLIADGH